VNIYWPKDINLNIFVVFVSLFGLVMSLTLASENEFGSVPFTFLGKV
jgi:hypothetical protein